MIAKELINYMIPPLKPSDDIGKAKLWMDEFRLSQLPVSENNQFLGVISEEMLFDAELDFSLVGEYPLLGRDCFVDPSNHYYDVLKIAESEGLKLVAVVNHLSEYLGVITSEDVVDAFARSSSIAIPGAILTLKLSSQDYSLSEISRLVESNDAKILTSYISEYPDDPSKLLLTIKLNKEEITRIVASLGNHGFQIESSFSATESDSFDKERLDIFMKYLKI
ncbi:MAG: CBS domain-containing protein [Cyclobacteriaceae bacterium]